MYALVDCNCFFASCERVFNPHLKDKPVVVLSNNDGCVVTRTREVKKLGVPMGAPYFKYKRLLEAYDVTVCSSNFVLYGDMSDRVMQTIKTFAPDIEYYSIDEAFVSLRGFSKKNLQSYGEEMRDRVYKWTGIPVAVGIGATKTLAKVATEHAKMHDRHDGVLDLSQKNEHEIDHILKGLPVEEVWGVGRQYAKLLKRYGMHTAWHLKYAKDDWVKRKMTKVGLATVHELRGVPVFKLDTNPEPRKSILSSRSFGRRVVEYNDLREGVASYVSRAATKLRSQNSVASAVTVFIMTGRHEKNPTDVYRNSKTVVFCEPTADTREMIARAREGLDAIYKEGYRYKKAGVYLSGIAKQSKLQRTFFEKGYYSKKQRRLMKALDEINNEWGGGTMQFAAEGIKKPWKMKSEMRSKKYTRDWNDLLEIND